jgi:hypothetical protein
MPLCSKVHTYHYTITSYVYSGPQNSVPRRTPFPAELRSPQNSVPRRYRYIQKSKRIKENRRKHTTLCLSDIYLLLLFKSMLNIKSNQLSSVLIRYNYLRLKQPTSGRLRKHFSNNKYDDVNVVNCVDDDVNVVNCVDDDVNVVNCVDDDGNTDTYVKMSSLHCGVCGREMLL